MKVIKSFSETKYARVGMEFDYAHMNYKLLEAKKNENLLLQDLFIYHLLSDQAKQFILSFNSAMNQQGYSYGECPTSGFCWGTSMFAYSKAPEKRKDYICRLYQRGDNLVVRLYLKNVASYATIIEKAPGYIQEAFINEFGSCNHCKENCKHRKTYQISGKEYSKCDGCTFEFYYLGVDSIPYYMDLLRLSNKSKKA